MDEPTVTLRPGSPRATDWMRIFRRLDQIPVTGYVPMRADLPGRPDSHVYMLDLKRIRADERERLVRFIAERFQLPAEEVAADLDSHGVPLLADDVAGPGIPFRLLI